MNPRYIKAKAIVVGIDDYDQAKKLENAVNDACAVANALRELKFYVDELLEITIDEWDIKFDEFLRNLNEFQAVVFYFAGHGVEIDGANYLLCKDTPLESKEGTKRYSIHLQDVVSQLNNHHCQTSILIVDACRENPFSAARAGYVTSTLAPIFAPRGTLIAYSTSPGETASDAGFNNHSIYTGAILEHIFELGLPVERFFKKVRTTVYHLSKEQQTPWEHTSLIGEFCFNSGQLIQNLYAGGYSDKVICRKDYDYSDAAIAPIISGFLSTQFVDHKEALNRMNTMSLVKLDKDSLFILGRTCMYAACYGSYVCKDFFENFDRVSLFNKNQENHFLNGALFEIYFSDKGVMELPSSSAVNLLDALLIFRQHVAMKQSFAFIAKVLQPFVNVLCFIPSSTCESTSIDVNCILSCSSVFLDDNPVYELSSIHCSNHSLLEKIRNHAYHKLYNLLEFKSLVSEVCAIPLTYLKLNYNQEFRGDEYILIGENPITPFL